MGLFPATATSVVLVLIVNICHEYLAWPHTRPRSRWRPQHLQGVPGKPGLQGGGEASVGTVTSGNHQSCWLLPNLLLQCFTLYRMFRLLWHPQDLYHCTHLAMKRTQKGDSSKATQLVNVTTQRQVFWTSTPDIQRNLSGLKRRGEWRDMTQTRPGTTGRKQSVAVGKWSGARPPRFQSELLDVRSWVSLVLWDRLWSAPRLHSEALYTQHVSKYTETCHWTRLTHLSVKPLHLKNH